MLRWYSLSLLLTCSVGCTGAVDGTKAGAGPISSEIANGQAHDQANKPILLLGSAGGAIKTGRHAKYNNEPQANLFITMLNALGVPATTFGIAGKTPLSGIT